MEVNIEYLMKGFWRSNLYSSIQISMDFILKMITEDLAVAEDNSMDQCTLLKERVEYCLILAMGYLYNKNIKLIPPEKIKRINENLENLTFGKVVSNIRMLDVNYEFAENGKRKYKLLDGYAPIRNQYIGHGYIHDDGENELKEHYDIFFRQMFDRIKWFQSNYEYILINRKDDFSYSGIRFDGKSKNQWCCARSVFEKKIDVEVNDTLLLFDTNYFKISPFICLENKGNNIYSFSSLVERRTGEVKLCRLLETEQPKTVVVPQFVCEQIEDDFCIKSTYGTIMNKFELNYKDYMETPVEQDIFDYLEKNTSNVQATLWGHGGVGKTATVQYVCQRIFLGDCGDKCRFKYIVFTTAKDRRFDPQIGKIVKMDNLITYGNIIQQIIRLVFRENIEEGPKTIIEGEEKIASLQDKLLLVIDDYETFSDADKQSIQEFINMLNLNYHRVIITTRNKRLANGISIQTNEFDEQNTINFFLSVIKNDYPKFFPKAKEIIAVHDNCKDIHNATEGRAISIHHLVNLLVQRGFSKELLLELHESENMNKFLYDRIYALLSEDAKKLFCCISLLVNKENLLFSIKTLEFITEEVISENMFETSIDEIIDQKVIEKGTIESFYRVYADNIYADMLTRYEKLESSVKDKIERKKKQLGGSFEIRNVDDALLAEARKTKMSGTYEEMKEKYLQLISKRKLDINIKNKAIDEYLDCVAMYGKDSIDILENKGVIFTQNEKGLAVKYFKTLYNLDGKGKKEVVELLMKMSSNIEDVDYDLLALKICYCVLYYVETNKVKRDVSFEGKIKQLLVEGKQLFNFIQLKSKSREVSLSNEFKEAIIMMIESTSIVYCDNEKELRKMKYYIEFAKKEFRSEYYDRVMILEREILRLLQEMGPSILKKYSRDALLEATVIKITNNCIHCKVGSNYYVQLFDRDNQLELRKYDKIFAKIKNITKYNEVEISYEGLC